MEEWLYLNSFITPNHLLRQQKGMKNFMKTIITLGRQLGSNGKIIGKALAEKLGFAFYDKNLIAKTAKENGLSESLFESLDETPSNSFLYSLVMGLQSSRGLYYPYNDFMNGDNVFKLQADTIRAIAKDAPCIIVGRCADYILRDNPHLIKLFLYASDDVRIKNLMSRDGMSEKEARSAINRADKRRSNYYNFYTNATWGDVNNYNLCIDTGSVSLEECVDIIANYVKVKEKGFAD